MTNHIHFRYLSKLLVFLVLLIPGVLSAQDKAEKIIYSVETVEGDIESWDIWIMDPDGSNHEPLISDPGTNGDPSVSRDGRFIKYNDFPSESTILKDLVTGRKWSFAWADNYSFDWSTWLPDDSAAVGWSHYSPNSKCGLNLATISKSGKFDILLERDAYLYPIGTSAGTNFLYYLEAPCTPTGSYFNIGDIHVLDLRDGSTGLYVSSSGKRVFRGDVSEDGLSLVYVEEGQILLVNGPGGRPQALTDGELYAYSPSFSLDGSYVVFVEGDEFGAGEIIKLNLGNLNRTTIKIGKNLDLLHWGYVITSSPPNFISFETSKSIVDVDEVFEVFWHVEDASSCEASGSWEGTKLTQGTVSQYISQPGLYEFRLDCTNLLGEIRYSLASIEVRAPEVVDADGDGYTSDVDCNDNNPWVHPGLTHDFCSQDGTFDDVYGLDFDCDGTFENGADSEKPEPNGAFFSDLAAMIFEKGHIYRDFTNPDEKTYDYCSDSTHVVEVYCCVPGASDLSCGAIYTCPGQCVDGACVPLLPVINQFTATPARIEAGASTELSWSVSDAEYCVPSGGTQEWRNLSITLPSDTINSRILQSGAYDYTLTCFNGEASDSKSVTVMVDPAPPIVPVTPDIINGTEGDPTHFIDLTVSTEDWTYVGEGTEVDPVIIACPNHDYEVDLTLDPRDGTAIWSEDLEQSFSFPGAPFFIYLCTDNPQTRTYSQAIGVDLLADDILEGQAAETATLYFCHLPKTGEIPPQPWPTDPCYFPEWIHGSVDINIADAVIPAVQIDIFKADPAEINKGQSSTLSWTVSNADSCIASGGAGGWAGSDISPGSGEITVTLSEAGAYNFLLECSNATSSDNASTTVTVVDNTQPDLEVTAVSANKTSIVDGDDLQINVTISNVGDGLAESSYAYFYLSTNQSITNLDQRLVISETPALEPGENHSISREPVVTTEPGTYWVGVCVDKIPNEPDYGNNCRAGPQITIEEQIEACNTQVIHCEEGYSGSLDSNDCSSGPLGTGHYAEKFSYSGLAGDILFLDAFWSFDGYLLIEDTSGLIVAENDNFTGPDNSRLEYNLPKDGIYTIWATSYAPESDGGFEVLLSCQSPTGPDLSVENPSVDTGPLMPGQRLQVSARIHNLGDSAADSTILRYLLSSDSIIDPTDAELAADGAPALNGGESLIHEINLVAPATPGNFWIGACTDAVSGESSVSNNCSGATPITVVESPECTVRSLPCGALTAGELTTNDCTRGPRGNGYPAEVFEFEVSAGRELVIGANWQGLDGFLYLEDPSDAVVAQNDDFDGPLKSRIEFKTRQSGVHRLWATSYERNTTGSYGVELRCGTDSAPDLQVSEATVDTSVLLPSAPVGVEATVSNAGNLSTGQIQVSYMLSYDPEISLQDERIATGNMTSLSAGESRLVQQVLSAPARAGNYWLGVCVEPVENEILTTNNCSHITESTNISRLQYTGTSKARPRPQVYGGEGTPIQVSNGNECQQTAISCNQTLSGTLSNQNDCDRSPRGAGYVSDLYTFNGQAGDTVSMTVNWVGLDGYLYLADSAGNVIGQNDDFQSNSQSRYEHVLEATGEYEIWPVAFDKNGQGSYDLKLTCNAPIAPDLVMEVPEISETSVRRGQSVTVSTRVENSGNEISQASSVRFFLSTSPILLSNIKLLGTSDLSSLESDESSDESLSVPLNVTPGTYYVGSCVNADSTELDTGNNCNVSAAFSVEDTFDPIPITKGLNDAWYNDDTSGQGFFITVLPDNRLMSLAWFTFDIARPPSTVTAQLGEPGHRWLTALGTYERGVANLDIFVSEGGVFDAGDPPAITEEPDPPFGTMKVRFMDCIHGEIEFDLPSIGQSGTIPIKRVVYDNVASCNDQIGELDDQQVSTLTNDDGIESQNSKSRLQAEGLTSNSFNYNPSLNDAWFNPDTNGQGFFFNVYPDAGLVFMSWFTFDMTRPPVDTPYNLGEPGHRWLNALGFFDGNKAELGVYNTSGGIFNSGRLDEEDEVNVGTISASFEDCNSGVIKYDIDPVGQGEVPIRRIAYDTIPDCEQKSREDENSTEAVTPGNKTLMANLCNGKLDWQFDWPDTEQASYYYFQLKRADSLPDDSPIESNYLFEKVSESHFRYQKSEAVPEDYLNGWTWRYIPKFTGPGGGESDWSETFTFDVKPMTDPCAD